jgi:Fe-S cluster assembly iron-binding protein IscA
LGLALAEPVEHEKLHEFGGIGFSISDHVLPYTSGQEIDYVTLYGNEGFLIAPVFNKGC